MEYEDLDDLDGNTIDCYQCGKAFYEDAPQCPYCGYSPLASDRQKPVWMVWVVGLMITAIALPFLMWLLGMLKV